MTDSTRRDFLRTGAAAAALSALPASMSGVLAEALAAPANNATGTIKDVEHVVILMLENRSFDHYFGTMRGVRGFGDRFPIPLASGKPVWFESDGTRDITPFHLDAKRMNALKVDTTSHEFADTQAAWDQGRYGFWPKFKLDAITNQETGHSMGHYTRAEIPFQFALADAFTLCDNYHASVLTGTDPNRIFFFSGSNYDPSRRAQGLNQIPATSEPNNLRCWIKGRWPDPGYTYAGEGFDWPTIPDVLQAAGISWRIYQDPNDNWTGAMNGCLAFNTFRNAKKGSPIYEEGMSLWLLDDLARHVREETLPQVSWVLPSQGQCEHAEGSSPLSGANFTAQVLRALVSNPEVWSKTALFITFDENDGYFDHVPPPAVPSINPDGSLAGAATLDVRGMYFEAPGTDEHHDPYKELTNPAKGIKGPPVNRYIDPRDAGNGLIRPLGMSMRVPMYVVSPWSKGGWVASQVFDHSSVGQFLEKRFGITVPAISPWNRAVAGDLTSAFDFASANDPTVPALPDTISALTVEAHQIAMPPALPPATPSAFAQEPGTRPSRPTPYELHVTAAVGDDGKVTLRFANTGGQGAIFHVYDRLHLDRIPRRYTVEAGKSLDDTAWDAAGDGGGYDLEVHSTNGFQRTVKGNVSGPGAAGLEAQLAYDVSGGVVAARLRNRGATSVDVRIVANAYREDGPWMVPVAPDETAERSWDVSDSGNWYDLTITAPGFERRFAGRMENGGNLISDPAMGM